MHEAADLLLEREAELAGIEAGLAAARAGSGGAVLVRGPAGIGKSRLLGAAAEVAAKSEMLVLLARGGELERDFAFGVARQLFEPAIGRLGAAERAAALEGAAALAAPALGHEATGAAGADRRFPVFHGLYWLCANLAQRRPVAVLVDDAHWADEPSLGWLAYLTRRVAELPVLVVVAMRPDDVAAALDAIAAEPVARTFEPRPLSVAAVGAIVARVTGAEPAAEVARACHERSSGNPFVSREIAAALARSGVAADHVDAVESVTRVLPGTVARAVLDRLRRLPAPAAELARAVALLGTEVHLVHAAAVAGLEERDAATAMDALVTAGFLAAATPLRFVHALMREAIYADLSSGQRLLLHRRAADVLAGAGVSPELVAAHLLQCEPRGDPAAIDVMRSCAARAADRGAPQTAARYLRRALHEPPAPEARGTLLRELGVAELRVGSADAVTHLEEAMALAGTTEEIGAATRELAISLGALGRMTEAVAALERGLAALAGADRELELRLEGELCALGQLDVSATPRVAARLRRLAPGLTGATPGERLVLASYAHLRSNELAPAEEIADLAERALGGGLLLREQTADAPVYYLLIYALYRAGRQELCDRALAEAIDDARARGSVLGLSIALAVRSQIRWLRGEVREAEADAQASMDAQVEAGWASVLPLAAAVLSMCFLERGEGERAAAIFDTAGLGGPLPELQLYRWAQAARGRARLAAGRFDEGLADLLDCQRDSMGARASIALEWRTDAALALVARGDVDEARRLADEQLLLARAAGVARPLGVALRTSGLLTDGEPGIAILAEAVDVLAASTARLEHARALVDLGAATRRAGRRGDAREHLRDGHELARACGSPALAERARQELAASGVRLRRPALAGPDALTPSERRVAEMAASGMSNPQIAQALFVTRKTIEMHLGRAYKKLKVARREELATVLTPPELSARGQSS